MARKIITPSDAEQAAGVLGVEVRDLGVALRKHSHDRYVGEANKISAKGARPDFTVPEQLLRAAEACESAHDERIGA